MSTSTFRETVALVATRAKEKLPVQVNGRVESAVKLVLAHDVTFLENGTIEVGSASDPLKVHVLTGTTCDCADFPRAPESWCKHRIAANLQKSVERVLARRAEPEPEVEVEMPADFEPYPDNDAEDVPPAHSTPGVSEPAPAPMPEAAFSLTLKGTLDGVEALLTARGATADEFRRNLAAIRGLLDSPAPPARHGPAADATPQCPTHRAAKRSTKGKGWYCPHKRDDGSWCPWKMK